MNFDNQVFTCLGKNSEVNRIIDIPEIELFQFENSNNENLEKVSIFEVIVFIKKFKKINFSDLKSINLSD